ncbi:MAG: ABC transporter permease [Comamonadaceae bacterium]|nr:ABC transporter permease [Comamonadaceae bacterium]
MQKNGPIAMLFHTLVVAFMLAPLLIVCLAAFSPAETLSVPTGDWSLRWFRQVFQHPDFVQAFYNSLALATAAASLSTALATAAAMAIVRYPIPGRAWLQGLFLSPLIIPHLVLGVAMLRLLWLVGGQGHFGWLILAHALVVTPYTMRLILAALLGVDRSVEQAAQSLGASSKVVVLRMTLPMILPGLSGGWLLAFINSFDELSMSIFVVSPSTVTLPVRMYMYATESLDPMMAAVSALIVFLTLGLMLLLERIYGLDRVLIGKH